MTAQPSSLSLDSMSDQIAGILDAVAPRLVTVHGRRHGSSSGFLWRSGLVVTAEEALEADEDVAVGLPDGSRVPASLAGRDPSTDVALLRAETQPIAETPFGSTEGVRQGHLVLAAGRWREGPSAAIGIVALAGGPWRSLRGGHIDRRLHLDVRLDGRSEGGAAVDMRGNIIGMAVSGPRRSVLVIPSETVDRVARQLLEHGRVPRGYLGLGLQPVQVAPAAARAAGLAEPRGLMVISIDADGPGQAAGLRQGDILFRWNDEPLRSVRSAYSLLGAESVGRTVEFGVLRTGEPTTVAIQVRERPEPR